MANSKGVNTVIGEKQKGLVAAQIENLLTQLKSKLEVYKKQLGKDYPIEIKDLNDKEYDFINPQHYIQDDGRQTWEHMVDEFGLKKTAIFCELNAYKYRDRIGKKPGENTERERKKIKWYVNKANELYAKSIENI